MKELLQQPTDNIPIINRECPITKIEEIVKTLDIVAMTGGYRSMWSFEQDMPFEGIYHLGNGNEHYGTFSGHESELPHNIDRRVFYTTRDRYVEIPAEIQSVLEDPKYGVDILF